MELGGRAALPVERAFKPAGRVSEPAVRAPELVDWAIEPAEKPWNKLGGSQSWLGGLEPAGGPRRHLGGLAERPRWSKLKAAGNASQSQPSRSVASQRGTRTSLES